MKILHIITVNGFGGAEKLLLQLLPALLQQQMEVHCMILNREENNEAAEFIKKKLTEEGVHVISGSYKNLFDKANLRRIRLALQEGQYSLVHSHLKYADTWMAFLKATKAVNVPAVATLHGYNDEYEDRFGFTINKKIYFSPYYWLTRFIGKNLDGFIFISEIVASFYRDIGMPSKPRSRIIYHGYKIQSSDNDGEEESSISAPMIAVPGRLLKRKGHLFAIQALESLQKQYPLATLHFFGSGPFEPELKRVVNEKKMEKKVIFHGYVQDIINSLRKCHIVLIPSMWEGFGIVFLDAFAAKKPVVAFDLPAGNEIISHGFNGLLAVPGVAASLAASIQDLCNDSELRLRIVKNAGEKLKTNFSIERMGKEYLEFYKTFS